MYGVLFISGVLSLCHVRGVLSLSRVLSLFGVVFLCRVPVMGEASRHPHFFSQALLYTWYRRVLGLDKGMFAPTSCGYRVTTVVAVESASACSISYKHAGLHATSCW